MTCRTPTARRSRITSSPATLCADDMRVAAAMFKGAKAGFAGGAATAQVVPMVPRPAVKQPVWYRSAALPWAAAAALAFVTTYQSFWVVPSLRRDVSARGHRPGVAAAGEPRSRGGGAAALRRSPDHAWRSKSTSRRTTASSSTTSRPPMAGTIVSGRAAAPAPGTPLLLLIPLDTGRADRTTFCRSTTQGHRTARLASTGLPSRRSNHASSRSHRWN